MAIKNDNQQQSVFIYRECPKCKKKMHIDRSYCVCGNDIRREHYYMTNIEPVMCGKTNFDLPYWNCEACEADCEYCAAFSVKNTDAQGWGGMDCKHKQDYIKCTCCQQQIKHYWYNETGKTPDQAIKDGIEAVQRILAARHRKVA